MEPIKIVPRYRYLNPCKVVGWKVSTDSWNVIAFQNIEIALAGECGVRWKEDEGGSAMVGDDR
jgi:hypothetical protein